MKMKDNLHDVNFEINDTSLCTWLVIANEFYT